VRAERAREVEIIAGHVELSLNTLIDRQQFQTDSLVQRQHAGEEVSLALQEASRRLDDLNDRLERRREELGRRRQYTLANVTHLGSAWVLPHPERDTALGRMVADPQVERMAIEVAMRHEREHGREPESVEAENRGFDLLSRDPTTSLVRFIEVKGRAGTDAVALTANEFRTAERLREDYWLYVVFDCARTPRLVLVHDPARLAWEPVVQVAHYEATAGAIEEAGGYG